MTAYPIQLKPTNENNGVCGPGNPWDWDGNAVITNPTIFNINPYGDELLECGVLLSPLLQDYNDWGNLFFEGILDATRTMPIPMEFLNEPPVPIEFR